MTRFCNVVASNAFKIKMLLSYLMALPLRLLQAITVPFLPLMTLTMPLLVLRLIFTDTEFQHPRFFVPQLPTFTATPAQSGLNILWFLFFRCGLNCYCNLLRWFLWCFFFRCGTSLLIQLLRCSLWYYQKRWLLRWHWIPSPNWYLRVLKFWWEHFYSARVNFGLRSSVSPQIMDKGQTRMVSSLKTFLSSHKCHLDSKWSTEDSIFCCSQEMPNSVRAGQALNPGHENTALL